MSADATAGPADRDAPSTVGELRDLPLRPGDPAVHISKPNLYFIVRNRNAPAGEIPASHGGTIAEWVECDPSADVVEAVDAERLKRSIVEFHALDDIFRAVEDGTVRPVAIPERRLYRLLDEFAEAKKRGEWDGLRDYLEVGNA